MGFGHHGNSGGPPASIRFAIASALMLDAQRARRRRCDLNLCNEWEVRARRDALTQTKRGRGVLWFVALSEIGIIT